MGFQSTVRKIAYALCRVFAVLFVKLRYGYSFEKLKKIAGPVLVLANHNTDLDPILVGAACPQMITFVATEKILRMGFLTSFVMFLFHPIIHYKGKTGISSVKEILHQLKNGGSIAFFPEGNRSFNGVTGHFVAATGKLARTSGATLVTYRLRGGYLTTPRWSVSVRKGKMRGEIANVYTQEQLRSMSADEVNEAIRNDLYMDAYADQAQDPVPYRGRDLAVGMESTVFACPCCGGISTLKGAGDTVECAVCSWKARYDVYGYLHERGGKTVTVTELDEKQRRVLRDRIASADGKALFHDAVTVQEIGKDHSVISEAPQEITAYADRFVIGTRTLPLSGIIGAAINQRNLLILHYDSGEGHLELTGDVSFSALKYLYLYQIQTGKNA